MDEEPPLPNRHYRIRRASSSRISSTTSPSGMYPVGGAGPAGLQPPAPRASTSRSVATNRGDIDDDVLPSSSTSSFTAPSFRRSINNNNNRSSSPLGSPDSTFWGPSPSPTQNSSYRSVQEPRDPGTPGGICAVSSSTVDDGPSSPFSPAEPQNPAPLPPPPPILAPNSNANNNSVSVISGTSRNPGNNSTAEPNPSPSPSPSPNTSAASSSSTNNINFSPSHAFNSMSSPLRSKIKKASSFERFSAQAQANSNNIASNNTSNSGSAVSSLSNNSGSINNSMLAPPAGPGPSSLMWDYNSSSSATSSSAAPSSSAVRPNFVSSINESSSSLSSITTKPFHIKKLAAKIASEAAVELERLEAETAATAAAAAVAAAAPIPAEPCSSASTSGTNNIVVPTQESLIRRQLSETPLNLTDSASSVNVNINLPIVSRNPVISTNSFTTTTSSTPRKMPLTPKQKLLHRMQSGELIIPMSTTPPPPPVPLLPSQIQPQLPPSPPPQHHLQQQLQLQQQHQLLLASLQQQQHQLLIQDSLHSGMMDESPPPPPSPPSDRYTNALSNYESFMRSTGGDDFSVQDAISKVIDTNDAGSSQILYDSPDTYNYYYGNILADEIFINGSSSGGGQASSSRGMYLHTPSNSGPGGLGDDVVNPFQAHGSHGGSHLEFVLGLSSPDDRDERDDELQLAGDDLSHQQQQFLDPNDAIAMAVAASKSHPSDSTLRNLLMMDPLVRNHDDSWISAAAAEYQNRMSNGNLRISTQSGNNSGPGSSSNGELLGVSNSWMNEWAPRTGLNSAWQGQGQQHLEREQDEVMDMSVMEIDKAHHSIIKRGLQQHQQHHAHSTPSAPNSSLNMDEVDLVSERDLSISNNLLPLPMDLQQPLNLLSSNNSSLSKNQIMSDPSNMLNSINSASKNINPMDLQHHRVVLQYDDEPVNLMSAVNLEQELAHHHSHSPTQDLSLPHASENPNSNSSYANVCISGSNIIFTTTSTSTTVAATAAGFETGHGNQHHFNILPVSDNIDERRLIRVRKIREPIKDPLGGDEMSKENSAEKKTNFFPDKPVQPKSYASLPSVLSLRRMNGNGWGVISNRNKKIPANARFGPVEGPLRKLYHEDMSNPDAVYPCLVMVDSANIIWQLDRTDDELCNWMKFVRRARSSQELNAFISEEDGLIYFTTCREIPAKAELQVGYGYAYAQKYGFAFMNCEEDTESSSNDPNPKKPKKAVKPKVTVQQFPCFECDTSCTSSDELHVHLETMHKESDLFRKPKKNAMKKFYNSLKNAAVPPIVEKVKKQPAESTTSVSTRLMKKEIEKIKEQEEMAIVESSSPDTEADNSGQPSSAPLPPPKVKCGLCYKGFANKERLEKHMMVHSDQLNKPLQCQYCFKRYFTNSALAGHLKTHAEENGSKCFECPICEFSTQQLLQLKEHVQTHKSKETGCFTCPRCSKVFGFYSLIRKHIRAFHGPRHFGCTECPMKFPTVDKLRLHELKHSSFRAYLCAECGKQFKRKDKLTDHTRKVHGDCVIQDPTEVAGVVRVEEEEEDTDLMPSPTKEKEIKKLLPRLTAEEFQKFVFRCTECMVGFRRRGMLVNHMANRHPDTKLEDVPELKLPITRPAKNYYCPHCARVYKSSSKRKAHILKNHPGKSVPPQLRGRDLKSILEEKVGSSSEVTMDTIHEGELRETVSVIRKEAVVGNIVGTPHGCQWCHRQYATRAKLLQHQRKHHVRLMPPEIQVPRTQKNNVGLRNMEDGDPLSVCDDPGVTISVGLSPEGAQHQKEFVPSPESGSVIGYYLTTTTVSSEQLGNLLQSDPRPIQHLHGNPSSANGTLITLSIPPGSGHHLHQSHHHPQQQLVTHMISNGINVSGSQILTKTD